MIQTIERRAIQKGSVYRTEILRVEGRVLGLRKEVYDSGAEDYYFTFAEKGFQAQELVFAMDSHVLRFSHTGRVLHASEGNAATVGQLINSNEEVRGFGVTTMSVIGLSNDQMKDFAKSDRVTLQIADNHDVGSVTLMAGDSWETCKRVLRAFVNLRPL